ncbi:MAG: hypothetical protein Kow0049_18060 [Stanieria sp.]
MVGYWSNDAIALFKSIMFYSAFLAINSSPKKISTLPIPNQNDGISCKAKEANNAAKTGSSSKIAVVRITGKHWAATE